MMSNADKAKKSFQILRGAAHRLLEEVFPEQHRRYAYLKHHAPKMHMSEMNKDQLMDLIRKLQALQ